MAIFSSYFSILLSLSLSLFIAIILLSLINLFKNHNHNHNHNNINIHSVLGFHGGIGLIVTAIRHVIVKKPPPFQPSPSTAGKRDAGVNDKNDGSTCCTESLGSESSVKSSNMDDTGENINIIDEDSCLWRRTEGGERRRKMSNHEVKSFPPPLSSLNLKGQPNFFLRPVRKDGRLELTRVRIHRPEILHVWRHDGRLTAHLIPDETVLDDREEQDQEKAELDGAIGGSEEEIAETRAEEEEEEVGFGEWKLDLGLMRCHQVVNHRHHHHSLHTCRVGIA